MSVSILLASNISLAKESQTQIEQLEQYESLQSCSSSQNNHIQIFFNKIKRQLIELNHPRSGIAKLNYDFIEQQYIIPGELSPSPKFRNHVSTYTFFHSKVSEILRKMLAKMNQGFSVKCSYNWNRQCSNNDTNAYVLDNNGKIINSIYLCPKFFEQNNLAQLSTLMHELSHLVDNKVVHYLGNVFNDPGMRQSAFDAYFYEKLVGNDWAWYYERNSWRLMWYKQAQ